MAAPQRLRQAGASNGDAGCQKGSLDGRTESDPSEQNNTMRSHGAFLNFQIEYTGFASGAAALRASAQPVWRPGSRTSASGDCFWRRYTTVKTSKIDLRLHVIAWYCFAPMGLTLCARLDDAFCSLNAHLGPHGTTFGRARAPLRQVRLQCHRSQGGLLQPLGCCHGP